MKLLQYLGRSGVLRVKLGRNPIPPKTLKTKVGRTYYGHYLLWDLETVPPTLVSNVLGAKVIDEGAVPPARLIICGGSIRPFCMNEAGNLRLGPPIMEVDVS